MPLFLSNFVLLFYFTFSIFLLLIAFVSIRYNSIGIDRVGLFLSYVIMTLFYGTRSAGTTDIKMYIYNFQTIGSFDNFSWGYGFYLLFSFLRQFSRSPEFFIFSTSLLFTTLCLAFSLIVLKNKPYKTLFMTSLFLGWFILDLATNTYRQAISLLFLMIAFHLLINKKTIKSVFIFFVSLLFHWGAIIPILICFFSLWISKRKRRVRIVSVIACAMFLLCFVFEIKIAFAIASSPIASFLDGVFFGANITSKMSSYLNAEVYGTMFYESSILRKIKFTIEALAPLLINTYFLFKSKNDEMHPDYGNASN